MATYQPCNEAVRLMVDEILKEFEDHQPLIDSGMKIDLVFAFPKYDDDGKPIGVALRKNGLRALGITRKVSLKDRAKGHGDAEICLDGEWWEHNSGDDERRALLDHELHHIAIIVNKHGVLKTDDLGRPQIRLRKHDVEIGWFDIVASRHGTASLERIQAKRVMDNHGQFYWPELAPTVEISMGNKSVTMSQGRFSRIAKDLARK